MGEIVKHNGDINSAIDASKSVPTTLDIDKLRKLAKDASSVEGSEKEEYITKK